MGSHENLKSKLHNPSTQRCRVKIPIPKERNMREQKNRTKDQNPGKQTLSPMVPCLGGKIWFPGNTVVRFDFQSAWTTPSLLSCRLLSTWPLSAGFAHSLWTSIYMPEQRASCGWCQGVQPAQSVARPLWPMASAASGCPDRWPQRNECQENSSLGGCSWAGSIGALFSNKGFTLLHPWACNGCSLVNSWDYLGPSFFLSQLKTFGVF